MSFLRSYKLNAVMKKAMGSSRLFSTVQLSVDAKILEHPAYEQKEKFKIDEYGLEGVLYTHKKSGAQVISVLAPEDDNKVFGITFRTPPEDSTGIPHVLEHSVLCGSKKFPVKEPFVGISRTHYYTHSTHTIHTIIHTLHTLYTPYTLYRSSERISSELSQCFHLSRPNLLSGSIHQYEGFLQPNSRLFGCSVEPQSDLGYTHTIHTTTHYTTQYTQYTLYTLLTLPHTIHTVHTIHTIHTTQTIHTIHTIHTIDPLVLQQEGWHYELEDPNSPLIFKGVVYNEMKGVYSSPDSLMGRATQQALFPSNTYGVDSGGIPLIIFPYIPSQTLIFPYIPSHTHIMSFIPFIRPNFPNFPFSSYFFVLHPIYRPPIPYIIYRPPIPCTYPIP